MPTDSEVRRRAGSPSLLSSRWWPAGGAVAAAALVALTAEVVGTRGADPLDQVLAGGVPLPAAAAWVVSSVARAESAPAALLIAAVAVTAVWWRAARLLMPAVLVGSWAATSALVYLLDVAFGRTGPVGSRLAGVTQLRGTFPFDHTATATVLCGLLAVLIAGAVPVVLVRTLVLGAGVLLSAASGLTALDGPSVWPTDALAGWLLGMTVVCAVTALLGVLMTLSGSVPPGDGVRRALEQGERVAPVRRRP